MIKAPKVKIVEMEEVLQELQPQIDAMKAIVKALKEPHDFIIYPVLWASILMDHCGGDMEQAKVNHSSMSELAIIAYMAMCANARVADQMPEKLDLATIKKPPGARDN